MSKLSLITRKNIKDFEGKRDANLKTIATASGVTFEVEVDWPVWAALSDEKGYKDRIGEVLYDWTLGGLAGKVTTFCKDALQKEAFAESFGTNKKITFSIHDGPIDSDYTYHAIKNDSGSLQIQINKNYFASNVADIGQNLSKACSGDGPLNVAQRKNIADNESKRVDALKKIKAATGQDFEVEVDWAVWGPLVTEKGYHDRVGEVIYAWYLNGLADNLVSLCKDEMSKEAFLEAAEKKRISFWLDPEKWDSKYVKCKFDDGVLVIMLTKDRFISNVGETGNDIAGIL